HGHRRQRRGGRAQPRAGSRRPSALGHGRPGRDRRHLGMTWIPPLLVAIPLLAAAVVAGFDHITPAPVQDALVIASSSATTALAFVLLWHAEGNEVVHWFGGWKTHGNVALGIDFAVGPLA